MEPRDIFHGNRLLRNEIVSLVLVIVAVFSFVVIGTKTTDPNAYQHEIQQIDEKIKTVLELTAASTATSALISLLPDDQATPIADQLADFSSYFLIALCALYLEKYLISLVGIASFKILLPIACLIGIGAIWLRNRFIRNVAWKIAIFAIIIYFIIPTSVKISDRIYNIYDSDINNIVSSAEETSELVESEDEDASTVDKVISFVKKTASSVTSFATDILSRFIEALAVMIVTSCLIPILVLMAFVWLAKLLFSIPISDQNVLDIPDDILQRLER